MESPMYRVLEHYEEYKNDNFVMIGLQGSQNYGLATEFSDVDTKMLVVPSLSDIVHNRKPISTTKVLDNNEHCDVKDVRLYWNCLRKQNINFVELLFTRYYYVSPAHKDVWAKLRAAREKIAFYDTCAAVKCMKGMAFEKLKALSHPYPAKLEVLDRFGYDPKQLHHILRLKHFIEAYTEGKPYWYCLESHNKRYLTQVKLNGAGMGLETATHRAECATEEIARIADEWRARHEGYVNPHASFVDELLDSTLEEMVKTSVRRELKYG